MSGTVADVSVRPSQEAVERELERVAFDSAGLICGIAQQYDTGEVLMVAWLSREALKETLLTGQVCYYSRSRQSLWRKGETSGQMQRLVEARLDCDGDAVLLLVDQTGVACHTGRRSCFYRRFAKDGLETISDPVIEPALLYGSPQ